MRVLYAGSFDPFHDGHRRIVERAATAFDEVVVAAVRNPGKPPRTPLPQRAATITHALTDLPNVEVTWYEGLTTRLAADLRVDALLRGAVRDLHTEIEMAHANLRSSALPTILLPAEPTTRHVSSTRLRPADA